MSRRAGEVNRYEAILLDKMVENRRLVNAVVESGNGDDGCVMRLCQENETLLQCIVEFRDPPKQVAVHEGYGAMCEGDA